MTRATRSTVRSLRRLAAVAAISSLALQGCGGGSSDAADQPVPSNLTLAVGGEPDDGFDPTTGWGRYGSPLFQSTLLQRNADLSWSGDLATRHELSTDGLTWTIDLRTDAQFSDGTPVRASDVAYTYNTAAKAAGLTDVTVLEQARAVDEDTVELRLKRPQSTFINRLGSLGIVPEKSHGEDYAQQPVGSGPFRLVSWEKGQQLIVERNDDYYGEKPGFERLTFLFTDEDATMAALRAGQVDVAGVPSSLAGEKIADHRVVAIPSLDNRALSLPTVPAGKTSATGAPVGNDVTSDVAVRRAINLVVDRQALVEGVLDGHGSPAFGPVDAAPWFEPATAFDDADLAGAQKLLEDAGWVDTDQDGVREKNGTRAAFTIYFPASDSIRQNLSLAVVDMLKPLGIKAEVSGASWEKMERVMNSQPVMWGWGSHDPIEMYNLLHSSQAGVEYNNPGFYSSAQVDRHLDTALAATTEADATKEWKAAQVASSGTADAPWAWLVNLDHTYYVNSCLDLGNSITEPHGHGWPVTANIAEWRWTC